MVNVATSNSSSRRASQRLQRKRKFVDDGSSNVSPKQEEPVKFDVDNNISESIVVDSTNDDQHKEENISVNEGPINEIPITEEPPINEAPIPEEHTDDVPVTEEHDDKEKDIVHENQIVEEQQQIHEESINEHIDVEDEKYHQDHPDKIKENVEVGEHEDDRNETILVDEEHLQGHEVIRVYSPGGTTEYVQLADGDIPDGEAVYVDENGVILGSVPPEELHEFENAVQPPPPRSTMIATTGSETGEPREVEFSFYDQKNVCCGMCGDVVPFDSLMSHHLPERHPEIMNGNGSVDFEEVPYSEWLKDKLHKQKTTIDGGSRNMGNNSDSYVGIPGPATQRHPPYAPPRSNGERVLRKVSQVRVNPTEMSIPQLENALRKKMVEKMGRKVPVTLVDKQHAQCGICQAIVSLNKKFEIVHLVRHFNAWHPSVHRCSGSWPGLKGNTPATQQAGVPKPLSCVDFAIVDSNINANDNLQCIWCGMFMDTQALAMHFYEVHPSEVEVPRCHLCLLELVVNARLSEKFGTDFQVTLPDEHHFYCGKFGTKYSKEKDLEKGIVAKLKKMETGKDDDLPENEDDDDKGDPDGGGNTATNKIAPVPESFSNSRMSLGRRSKPKRHFVQPALRQAAPKDSQFIEVVSLCHWKCKLCGDGIMAAVISAGAIRHFRSKHPDVLDQVQVELCKARLEKVSDGCMEFINPTCIECRVCQMSYPLHKPYNMCRAIRHLKAKHPQYMPEYSTDNDPNKPPGEEASTSMMDDSNCYNNDTIFNDTQGNNPSSGGLSGQDLKVGELVTDPSVIAELREKYGVEFDKVQQVTNSNGEQIYILMTNDQELDDVTIQNML